MPVFVGRKRSFVGGFLTGVFLLCLWGNGRKVCACGGRRSIEREGALCEELCAFARVWRGKETGRWAWLPIRRLPTLRDNGARPKTESQLRATIEQGRPPTAMEGWTGQLSEAEIEEVLAYVVMLRKRGLAGKVDHLASGVKEVNVRCRRGLTHSLGGLK